MAPSIDTLTVYGAPTLSHNLATLRVVATSAAEIAFSPDDVAWSDWETYSGEDYEIELTPGDGARVAYVKVRDVLDVEAADDVSVTVDTESSTMALVDNLSTVYARDLTGLLYELLSAVGARQGHIRESILRVTAELNIQTAQGHWLEVWGKHIGVGRQSGEVAAVYANRAVERLTDPKLGLRSVRAAVLAEAPEATVSVYDLPGYVVVEIDTSDAGTIAAIRARLPEVVAVGLKSIIKSV